LTQIEESEIWHARDNLVDLSHIRETIVSEIEFLDDGARPSNLVLRSTGGDVTSIERESRRED
jgi:hypothetical protein